MATGLQLLPLAALLVGAQPSCETEPKSRSASGDDGCGGGGDELSALQSLARSHRAPKRTQDFGWDEANFEHWLGEHPHEPAKRQGVITVGVWNEASKGGAVSIINYDMWRSGIVGGENSSAPCSYSCRYLGHDGSDSADVLMIDVYQSSPPKAKRPGQIWVGHFWEAPVHRIKAYDTAMEDVDITASYRPDSTFSFYEMMTATAGNWSFKSTQPKHTYEQKKLHASQTGAMMSAWISSWSDESQRMMLLEDLDSRGIGVLKYGTAPSKHLRAAPNAAQIEHTQDALQEEAGKYLFFFAAENARCPYYHTEKAFNGLKSGSLPVYVGHRTIKEYLPPGSFINADDFASSKELADYLIKVANDEKLYNSFFEWRDRPLPEFITSKLQDDALMQHSDRVRCDFCQFLHVSPSSSKHVHMSGCEEAGIQVSKPVG